MKYPLVTVTSTFLILALAAVSARAQMGFSPSAPPVTSSGINRSSGAAPLPAVRPPLATAASGVLGGAVPSGYPTAAQQVPGLSTEAIDPDQKLNRGDQLSYRVQEDRDDKVYPLVVTDTGEVQLPLGGRVRAVGKSTRQLAGDIKSQLEREYYYHATVELGFISVRARTSRGRVYVAGAVKQTGFVELPLDAPLTASEAVYQMGGPVDFSNLKKARVMRKGGPARGIPVNIKAVEDGKLDQDVVLEPDDKVIVPESKFNIAF